MVSLLVPTMNRSEFVIRLLKYYDNLKFKYHILIGDSSDAEEFEKTNKAATALKGRLKVEHCSYPGLNNYAVTERLIQKVSTPYSSFLPDDDFYVPDSIEKCLAFLNRHPDYNCAWGRSIMFNLKDGGAYGQFRDLGPSNSNMNYSIEGDKAKDRLFFHIGKYTSLFVGVCRTATLKKALREASELGRLAENKDIKWWTAEQWGEIAASFSLAAQGKVKTINCLYWIRQNHRQRYLFPDPFDWVTSPNWQACYEIAARQIAEDIVERDSLKLDEAEKIWKKVFWMYLSRGFYTRYQKRYALRRGIRGRIKEKVKQAPALYNILLNLRDKWNLASSNFTAPGKNISLQSVLNPSFPYYADFFPVYKLITDSGGPAGESA